MITYQKPIPGYQVSVVRLSCSVCGAEANASCSCGQPHVPMKERVAEYDKANPGRSTRQAAADLDVDHSQVVRARQQSRGADAPPETITGRDGKAYPATKPKLPIYEPEPGESDLIDFIVDHFMRLSRTAQTRCAIKLRNIIQGRA